MRAAGAVLAVAVLLAGCSGLAGDSQHTPTVTPAPVPTAEPTPPDLAPGLNTSGVYDPEALAGAHARAIRNTPYTVHANRTVRYPNGTLWARRTVTLRLAGDGSRFAVRVAVAGPNAIGVLGDPPASAVFWSANDRRIFRAFTSGNSTTYNTFRPRFSPVIGRVGTADYWRDTVVPGGQPHRDVRPLFAALRTRLVGRDTGDGPTRYRIQGTGFRDRTAFSRSERVGAPRNASLRAVVDERGLVRRYRLAYNAVVNGDTVTVRRRIRYAAVGSTTIDRPPWYDRALAETPVGGTSNASTRTSDIDSEEPGPASRSLRDSRHEARVSTAPGRSGR